MATLTGSSVASTYDQLLSLPGGGGDTSTLVAVTDGDGVNTFAMQLSTTTLCVDNPTTSSSTQGGILRLQSDDGAVMASGHRLGVIEFGGAEDTSNTITTGARIEALADATWSASENGADLVMYTTDGNAAQAENMRIYSDSTSGVQIQNTTTSSATEGGKLKLTADDGAALGDTHRLGVIEFNAAEDGSNNITTGARIEAIADAAWSASENGADMLFYTTDGNASQSEVMRLTAEGAVGIGGDPSADVFTVKNSSISSTTSWKGVEFDFTKTAGASDASDNFYGTKTEFVYNDGDAFWGTLFSSFIKCTSTAAAGEANEFGAIFAESQFDGGDVEHCFGNYFLTDVNGGTVDDKIYGVYHVVDTTVNPGDKIVHQFWDMSGSGADASGDLFLFVHDGVNGDVVAQITAVAGVATFDSGDFSGAPDYAEYFESKDGNAIAVGTTVKLDGDKVVACEEGDTPIGVVRPDGVGTSAYKAGAQNLKWQGKYVSDDYNERQHEDYTTKEWTEEITEEEYTRRGKKSDGGSLGGKATDSIGDDGKYYREHRYHSDRIPDGVTVPDDAVTVANAPTSQRKKLNPDFDPSLEYESRPDRDEWCLIGLLGQIPITKGQPMASHWMKMKDISDTVEQWFVK